MAGDTSPRSQAIHRHQGKLGKPATRRPQTRVHPVARLDVGTVAERFDDAGYFET